MESSFERPRSPIAAGSPKVPETALKSLEELVLVVQDKFLAYMTGEFKFDHVGSPAIVGDSLHIHSYRITRSESGNFRLNLAARLSTDANGIAACLGLQAEARVELEQIVASLQAKISPATLFRPV